MPKDQETKYQGCSELRKFEKETRVQEITKQLMQTHSMRNQYTSWIVLKPEILGFRLFPTTAKISGFL